MFGEEAGRLLKSRVSYWEWVGVFGAAHTQMMKTERI